MPAKEELKNRKMTTIGFEKQVRKMICMAIEPKDVIADLKQFKLMSQKARSYKKKASKILCSLAISF